MSTLYVVGTPIGNLGDISSRAIDVLRSVHTVIAEDTRVTRKLLSHFEIRAKLISYNENNRVIRIPSVLQELDKGDVAITTDAGTPSISDPGTELMKTVGQSGHQILTIPGPSALTAAISMSPFQINRFAFLGFVPRRKIDIEKLLKQYDTLEVPLVFFDSPHRITKFLDYLSSANSNRMVMITREMTKLHEERFVGTVTEALIHFENPLGEFTIILEPVASSSMSFPDDAISGLIKDLSKKGWSSRDIVQEVASTYDISKKYAYKITLDQLNNSNDTESQI